MKKRGNGAPQAPATALSLLCLAMLALPGMARAQDAVPSAAHVAAPVAAPERQVTIEEYLVRGNTVLDARAIEEAVTPFLGPGR
ncbi:ShlB/FhaC/HecB family hemolysin secretion/activation protein, partial [Janthinobacterium sp. SUN073]|nr:ShlB/FhaC/HecB family hemolysin secretion/activation protein [Janthinobacterium sp. SUN073]